MASAEEQTQTISRESDKAKMVRCRAKFTCSHRVVTASVIQIIDTKTQIRTSGFEVCGAGHIYVVGPTFEEELPKKNQIENISQSTDYSRVKRGARTNGKRWERLLATLGQVLLARFWNGRRKQFQK